MSDKEKLRTIQQIIMDCWELDHGKDYYRGIIDAIYTVAKMEEVTE